MTTDEREDLKRETVRLAKRTAARMTKLAATIEAGKINGAWDAVYDSASDLETLKRRVSTLSASPNGDGKPACAQPRPQTSPESSKDDDGTPKLEPPDQD